MLDKMVIAVKFNSGEILEECKMNVPIDYFGGVKLEVIIIFVYLLPCFFQEEYSHF